MNTLPERGAYSRIGACPYLSPQLINSRCCPCKGRISWAGLAPQHLSRYEPLTGARFINRLQEVGASPYPKYEPPSGALARQIRDIRAALRGLKAQQVRSPGQRPGLTYVPHRRPVRAKVKANHSPILLPLQGVGVYTLTPRALPWAGDWQPFQGTPFAICSFIMCVCFATYCLAKKRTEIFWILNTLLKGTSEAFATCIHQQTL